MKSTLPPILKIFLQQFETTSPNALGMPSGIWLTLPYPSSHISAIYCLCPAFRAIVSILCANCMSATDSSIDEDETDKLYERLKEEEKLSMPKTPVVPEKKLHLEDLNNL